jgi:hypothetical protein
MFLRAGPQKEERMKVKYIGDTKDAKTVDGKDAKLSKGMELECMEKEYHSASQVRALLPSGDHIKIKRSELKKIDVC